jgi:hypothetical protein
MKRILLYAGLVAALATTGATCINEDITVPVNVPPMTANIPLGSGSTTSFNGTVVLSVGSLIDEAYLGNVSGGQVYDIKISVTGNYPGGKVNPSTATVNGKTLCTFSGDWSAFQTAQSLLGGSTLITTNAAGVDELVKIFTQGSASTTFSVGATGSVTPSQVPSGLRLIVEVYAQANARVN